MSSIYYYENLIDDCNIRIRKYKGQVEGLEAFKGENGKGADIFSTATVQRRNQINNSLENNIKHPMVKKLHNKISKVIDKEYENTVLDNFDGVKKEIHKVINKLLDSIEEEEEHIATYKNKIQEIIEEERREAERRAEERRAEERREEERREAARRDADRGSKKR